MNDDSDIAEIPAPEDFLPAKPRPLQPFDIWPQWQDGKIAWLLFAAAILVSLNQWQMFYFVGAARFDFSASYDQVFVQHEYWRLVSAIFAHANFAHIANNSITFVIFAWLLSAYFGKWAFPVCGLLIGIASNAITLLHYGPGTSLLGASGMNYGLVAQWLVLYIRFDQTSSLPMKVTRSLGFGLMMLIPQQYDPKVSYAAHVSGFFCGMAFGHICALFLRPRFPVHATQRLIRTGKLQVSP